MCAGSLYIAPESLLDELGIARPEEILIEAIAEYCDATVVYEPLRGCAARIVGYKNRAIVTVDSKSTRERQRFSAGHELGHWLHDRGTASFGCTEQMLSREWGAENPERRANRYAAELLLPEVMFRERTANRAITLATATDLAKTFQASLTATAIRLVQLGSFPALVACYERAQRVWYTRGPDVPPSFSPRDNLHKNAVAFDLMAGGHSEAGPVEVAANTWFDLPGSKNYVVLEDSVKISADHVLTLVWWKNQRQLLDFNEDEDE